MIKYYMIDDFVEELNYKYVIIYISEDVKKEDLRKALIDDDVNHISRFDEVWESGFFYIENCDLQTLDVPIEEIFREWEGSWSVLTLKQVGDEFVILVPHPIAWGIEKGEL